MRVRLWTPPSDRSVSGDLEQAPRLRLSDVSSMMRIAEGLALSWHLETVEPFALSLTAGEAAPDAKPRGMASLAQAHRGKEDASYAAHDGGTPAGRA